MKRQFILVMAVLCAVSAAALVADEAILIDFSKLAADILPQPDPANPQKTINTQNSATMMDFASMAGQSFTKEQRAAMKTSLAPANWSVTLASSSRTNMNQLLSITKEAAVSKDAKQFAGQTVLGIRVHFPTEPFNSWARISPPFEIPAFEPKAKIDSQGNITKDTSTASDPVNARMTRFEGTYDPNTKISSAYGLVKNVGIIKKVAINVKGLNFPHALSIILKDSDDQEQVIFMGYLNFDGWRELTWENPNYVKDVRNRELRVYPLYPKSTPFVKFDSFLVQRDAAHEGGDFITYVKDVKIIYDKAVLEPLRDIDDEEVWGIINDRETQRTKIESRRFGQQQVMRYLEGLKQESKDEFTPSEGQKAKEE
jgi:hypothetical protein